MSENKKIKEEDYKKIQTLINEQEKLLLSIGVIEFRKQEMLGQCFEIRHKMDLQAKEAIVNTGIPPVDVEKYKLNMQSGEIVEKGVIDKQE